MADHLTPEQLARYAKRTLSPAELLAADDHLAACETCRQRAGDPQSEETAFAFLRQDLAAQAKLGLSHVSYEQMESYVDNDADASDREIVDSHVELCRTCREELRELQEFRVSLGSRDLVPHGLVPHHVSSHAGRRFSEPFSVLASADDRGAADDVEDQEITKSSGLAIPKETFWQRVGHLWRHHVRRHPGYLVGAAAAVVAVLVCSLFIFSPTQQTKTASLKPEAQSTRRIPDQTGESHYAESPTVRPWSPEEIASFTSTDPMLKTPASLAPLIGEPGTLLGSNPQSVAFTLLAPVGTFVENGQLEFRWQRMPGAVSYRVNVFDETLKEVSSSPVLSETKWNWSGVGLQGGKVYLWQVTATKKHGEQIVAPAPPAPEAKFEVLEGTVEQLEELKRKQPDAHFMLGRAFAYAGLLDEAEREFRSVSSSDPNYELTQKFIRDLEVLRHPK